MKFYILVATLALLGTISVRSFGNDFSKELHHHSHHHDEDSDRRPIPMSGFRTFLGGAEMTSTMVTVASIGVITVGLLSNNDETAKIGLAGTVIGVPAWICTRWLRQTYDAAFPTDGSKNVNVSW